MDYTAKKTFWDAKLKKSDHQKYECVICAEDKAIGLLAQLPCKKHWACRRDCLPDFFERAIENQSLYPPECCDQTLLIKDYDRVLPADLIARYLNKTQEYHTDPRLRRYCPKDNTFLPPESYKDHGKNKETTVAQCSSCSKNTCIVCKTLVNPPTFAHDCKQEKFQMNKEYTPDNRFKGCPFCGRLGILEQACNHITCSCNGEWCFICFEPWKDAKDHEECKQYGDPEYDEEGYDAKGFHRDTGFDREGYTRAGYNIRGLNRQGERMRNFATRIVTHEGRTDEQRRWNREFRLAMDLSAEGFDLFVTNAFARFDGDPDGLARFQTFVVNEGWLDAREIGLQNGNAMPNNNQLPDPFPAANAQPFPGFFMNPDAPLPGPLLDLVGQLPALPNDLLLQPVFNANGQRQAQPNNNPRPGPLANPDAQSQAQPQAPAQPGPGNGQTQAQLSCQHTFDYLDGRVRCQVCSVVTPGFHGECTRCHVRVCGQCARDFADSEA